MSLLLGIHLNISSVEICVMEPENRCGIITVRHYETDDKKSSSASSWWRNLCNIISDANASGLYDPDDIMAIGIQTQVAGVVLVDKNNALTKKAFVQPGDLGRIKMMEPKKYADIHKILLPGDFIGWKLTGEVSTITWPDGIKDNDFRIEKKFIPPVKDNFSIHGYLKDSMVDKFGFGRGVPVSFKSCQAADLHEAKPSTAAAIGAGIGAHLIKDPGIKCSPGSGF